MILQSRHHLESNPEQGCLLGSAHGVGSRGLRVDVREGQSPGLPGRVAQMDTTPKFQVPSAKSQITSKLPIRNRPLEFR
jgi:hypothetical protein